MVVLYACDGCRERSPADDLFRAAKRPPEGFRLWCMACATERAALTDEKFIRVTVMKATAA